MSPDISLCNDHACPSAKRCYRHEAKPSDHQCYSDFGRGKQSVKCGHFILMSKSVKKRLDVQTGRQRD